MLRDAYASYAGSNAYAVEYERTDDRWSTVTVACAMACAQLRDAHVRAALAPLP